MRVSLMRTFSPNDDCDLVLSAEPVLRILLLLTSVVDSEPTGRSVLMILILIFSWNEKYTDEKTLGSAHSEVVDMMIPSCAENLTGKFWGQECPQIAASSNLYQVPRDALVNRTPHCRESVCVCLSNLKR